MAVRSVIDVDIDTAKFRRFQELFDKYQAQLAKTPAAWGKVNKANAEVANQFERMSAALLAQNELTAENSKAEKDRADQLKRSETSWSNIAKASGTTARNMLKIGESVLKWGTIIGAGLLGGSLLGLDKLGNAVSGDRRSSLGLGLSIGQQKSFDVNFGRFVNPSAFLSGINNAVTDPSQAGPLYGLGVNPNQSTEKVALDTLDAVRKLAKATPVNLLGTLETSRQLGNLGFSVEDLRRLRDTSDAEYGQQRKNYGAGANAFNLNDKTALAWQNFTTSLQASGAMIFKTFVQGLTPLTGPIEKLSKSFSNLLEGAFKNDAIKNDILAFSDLIDTFAKKLGSGEFMSSVDKLISDTGSIADAIHSVADAVKNPGETVGNWASNALKTDFSHGIFGGSTSYLWNAAKGGFESLSRKAALSGLANTDASYGLPSGTLETIWGKEAGYKFDPGDQPGKNGAQGAFQIKPSMQGGIDPHDFDQAKARAAWLIAQELKHYHGDVQKAIAAYNLGDPTLDALIKKNPNNWQSQVPYLQNVVITDKTGGSVNVALSQQIPH